MILRFETSQSHRTGPEEGEDINIKETTRVSTVRNLRNKYGYCEFGTGEKT